MHAGNSLKEGLGIPYKFCLLVLDWMVKSVFIRLSMKWNYRAIIWLHSSNDEETFDV